MDSSPKQSVGALYHNEEEMEASINSIIKNKDEISRENGEAMYNRLLKYVLNGSVEKHQRARENQGTVVKDNQKLSWAARMEVCAQEEKCPNSSNGEQRSLSNKDTTLGNAREINFVMETHQNTIFSVESTAMDRESNQQNEGEGMRQCDVSKTQTNVQHNHVMKGGELQETAKKVTNLFTLSGMASVASPVAWEIQEKVGHSLQKDSTGIAAREHTPTLQANDLAASGGQTKAEALKDLVERGCVISGTPDGVLAVHGLRGHTIMVDKVSTNSGAGDKAREVNSKEAATGVTCGKESDPIVNNRMWLFGCKIRNIESYNGLGFSGLAGPRKNVQHKASSFVFGPRPSQHNATIGLEGKANGTLPVTFGTQEVTTKWADILGTKVRGTTKLTYIPPSIINGKPVVHVKSEQFAHKHQDFRNSLIGSFIGKKPAFDYVNEMTSKAWNTRNYNMRIYGDHSFCFEFKDPNEKRAALEVGSLHIASRLFIIQEWKPFIEADLQNLKTIPVWVIFHKFPEELWNEKGFSQVASAIGQPMFPDKRTESETQTTMARICVEIATDCAFSESVEVRIDECKEVKVEVEYKWKPPLCKTCNIFGHTLAQCPKKEGNHQKIEGDIWQVKKTNEKRNMIAKAWKQVMNKEIEDNNMDRWNEPTKKQRARRVQIGDNKKGGAITPTYSSVFACLSAIQEDKMEEIHEDRDPCMLDIT